MDIELTPLLSSNLQSPAPVPAKMSTNRRNNNLSSSDPKASPPIEGILPIVQDRIQKEVFAKSFEKWSGDMLLIVDQESLRVISSAFGMYKLMENRVYLVEHLTKKRAPYRKSAPIYFLSPTEASINQLVQDWTPSKIRKEPLYADVVFVYFTRALSDDLFQKIKACKPLVKRLRALGELNIDFIANQSKAFHFDMKSPEYFAQLFRAGPGDASFTEHAIAEKLVTVCASLNEYPHIRYKRDSRVGTSIAKLFNDRFTEFITKNKNWWYHGDPSHMDKGRATLLITARTDDCLSPLIHEFTYEAMVNDLLTLKDDLITFESKGGGNNGIAESANVGGGSAEAESANTKDVLLNENDSLWVELRGKHIADVIQILSGRIREIVNSNTSVALNTSSNNAKSLSLNQMAKALKALPEYREVMSKLSEHMHISHQCMNIFKRNNLLEVSELEQTLATGKDDEGRTPTYAEVVEEVIEKMSAMSDSKSRFRLLAILIVSQNGIKPSDQGRLFQAANLDPEETKALGNLNSVGLPLVKESASTGRRGLRADRLVQRQTDTDSGSEYSSSRYACELKGLLKGMHENSLSFDKYPSVYPMPEEDRVNTGSGSLGASGIASVRGNTGTRFRRNVGTNAAKYDGGARQIVFVAGGACFSELRAAQELMDSGGPEVIVGTTNFIDPSTFIEYIGSL